MWDTVGMTERAMRIITPLGQIPREAICTACGRKFIAPKSTLVSLGDSTAHLEASFEEHKCPKRPEDANQAAFRVVREATEGK